MLQMQRATWLSMFLSALRMTQQLLPVDIINLIQYKRRLRKKRQVTRCPVSKRQLNLLTKLSAYQRIERLTIHYGRQQLVLSVTSSITIQTKSRTTHRVRAMLKNLRYLLSIYVYIFTYKIEKNLGFD